MKIKTLILFFLIGFLQTPIIFSQNNQISLNDIWRSRKFFPERITEIRSMNDGLHYTVLEKNTIIRYQYKDGKSNGVILDANNLLNNQNEKLVIQDYAFSKDESKILLTTSSEAIYRHSFVADYYVYDLNGKKLQQLSANGKQGLADFSPDGNKIAFVRNNNIFIKDLLDFSEQQITFDGEFNKIINGAPDWVYEEEFSFSKGFFWSPDAKKIAYYKFDESHVKEYSMFYYRGAEYPEIYTYKYPKAGEANSYVDIFVYNLETKKNTKIDVGPEKDQYIPRVGWTNNSNQMWFQRLNRHQNHFELFYANPNDGKSTLIYEEKNKYYVDITDNLMFLADNKHFILSSEKDGYNHLYLFTNEGKLVNQITIGNWDVNSIQHIDQRNKTIYYTSSENGPQNKMLYSVRFDGKQKRVLFQKPGHYSASFSKNSEYFILTYTDANTPPQYAIYNSRLRKVVDLQDNQPLIDRIAEYNFVKKEFFTITTSEGVELNAWMMKPAEVEKGKKLPVLMYVYGGPGSQTVENSWGYSNYIWFQMLVQQGFVVVSVDNRGTGGRGEEFKKCTYLQLGNLETLDQIESAKYLGGLEFIDKEKIGIFGWSYGGYISSLCLTRGADVFNTGIAVAPVTNWRYYDNIYTERFMRTPQENPEGYDHNSPTHHADKLKGNYLIIHGEADDNVHVQNAMEFVESLVAANKQFEMFIYPNRNHGIFGGNTRYHLYQMMNEFLYKHLTNRN